MTRGIVAIAVIAALSGCAAPVPDSRSPSTSTEPRAPWPSAPGPGRVDVAWGVARVGSTVVVEVRATVEAGWHIYGLTSEYGVHPALELELDPSVAPVGSLVEPTPVAELALDELPITAHRGTVVFTQALSAGVATRVPVRFRWQVCNDPDTYCSPGVSEVTLILPGPDGRAPGVWELAPGLTVTLCPVDRWQWASPSPCPWIVVEGVGGQAPDVEVTPPPEVSARRPFLMDLDGAVSTIVGLDGPTVGTLAVRIEHLGVKRTVVLPFAP